MGTDQASHTRSPPEGSRQQEETVRDGRRGPLAEADAEPIGTWLPTCSMLHVGFHLPLTPPRALDSVLWTISGRVRPWTRGTFGDAARAPHPCRRGSFSTIPNVYTGES